MSVHIRSVRSLSHARFGSVELITGGLLLIAAALAMLGPLIAALLIRHSGADRAPTTPVVVLTLAMILATTTGLTLLTLAHRRSDSNQPNSS
ncbi:hypothetical protein ACFWUP_13935 [Nocardia sp. NPDC058658]|uniref:hypothetical protein n=1 Tax=Nocardia sp. NPDC058658 TaxID=3346580 RepID=UPI0036500C76